MQFIIGKTVGIGLALFALIGGLVMNYGNVQIQWDASKVFWVAVLILGLYISTAAEAASLRANFNYAYAHNRLRRRLGGVLLFAVLLISVVVAGVIYKAPDGLKAIKKATTRVTEK